MSERERLQLMLKRTSALADRNTVDICQHIQTRTNLSKLDDLFTLGERIHALYRRIQARYDATRPQWMRDIWNEKAS